MKVVGLLSGGKDSCYNLLHCVQQGHEIVALATLAPAAGGSDELDSYMYQTVGHDAVHLVAQAMQLPLYRQTIRGSALNQGSEYGSRSSDRTKTKEASANAKGDETEDLYELLLQVKHHHPDIEAVSVGAILSNYQRVRVEHVCLRDDIKLQPLTFLWQRSQAQLMNEMTSSEAAPFTSILIKVAGIGLSETDLGKTLRQVHQKLVKLHNLYGAHICGEGGEYETLTLDSPMFFSKIVIDETETVIHSDSAFGSVSYLRITKAHLELKEPHSFSVAVRAPDIYDSIGKRTLRSIQHQESATDVEAMADLSLSSQSHSDLPSPTMLRKGRWLTINNVTGQSGVSLEEEVVSAFSSVSTQLGSVALDLTHIAHVNLFLSDQSLFPAINAVYKTHFGVSPPTRACVGLRLPQVQSRTPPRFMLSVVVFDDTTSPATKDRDGRTWASMAERKALHVQSRSFWAPANIGPYSQAVVPSRTDRIYIAGQIGLLPSDLRLSSAIEQNSLSIQHARRIYGAVMGDMASRSSEKGWIEGGICWVEASSLHMARDAWLAQLPSDEDEAIALFANDQETEEDCWLGRHVRSVDTMPPVLFATLAHGALPRGAVVEWQLTAHTGRIVTREVALSSDSDLSDSEDEQDEIGLDATSPTPNVSLFTVNGTACDVVHHTLSSAKTHSSFGILSFSTPPGKEKAEELATAMLRVATKAYSIQLYYTPSQSPQSIIAALTSALDPLPPVQYVPVDDLHTLDSKGSMLKIACALVWHGV